MKETMTQVKLFLTAILSYIVANLGGYDTILSLLVSLIVIDIVTGIILAFMNKKVSSTELKRGIIRKAVVFLIIYLAYRVDLCVLELNGEPLEILGVSLSIRTMFIVYFCIEEFVSILENVTNLGVPMPMFVKDSLQKVSDSINTSTPKEILELFKRVLSWYQNNSKK